VLRTDEIPADLLARIEQMILFFADQHRGSLTDSQQNDPP